MDYVFLRLQEDEELRRRVTQDGAEYLIGPIPGGPKPGSVKAQSPRSPKPRSRPHTPVANALAAWRAYVARRHAQGETPA
jgi:hypothetical protein